MQKLDTAADPVTFAMVLLDDITERRALERTISNHPQGAKPQLGAAEAEAFHQLGRCLTSRLCSTPVPEKPRRTPVVIPRPVTNAIDKFPQAVLISKGDQVLHANPKALEIFGYGSVDDLINDNAVWTYFSTLGHSVPVATLALENGSDVNFAAQLSEVAWQNGPARQFILKPVTAPVAKSRNEVKPVPPPVNVAPVEAQAIPATREIVHSPEIVQNTQPVADEELRAILDTATDGIITLDRDGKIHTFSAGAEAIFGYRIAEVADKPFGDLLAPDSRKVLRDYLSACRGRVSRACSTTGASDRQRQAGGSVPLFLTIGRCNRSSRAAFCAVVRDITQWKRTE